ncbi:MAG TPA: FAD-dependent oxidoreductase [Polyangiaceae bacterium]|nr:FAD-dependent oxidoreductase [Polyangiaceae bacterium]
MQETRFLVIGAGVTGLAFAGHLNDPSYLICEAEAEIGGYCRTVVRDGFVWDYSGHFFHFRHPDIERELVSRIGAGRVRHVVKRSSIHYAGRLIDYPFQRNIHQLPEAEFLECLRDLFQRPPGPAQSFREMLHSKFGRGIAQKFLQPYNEKLYATDLGRLDVDAMGRFFPYADAEEIVRGLGAQADASYNATFTYPEGGAIEYIEALAQDVDRERILLGEPVIEVDLRNKVARTSKRSVRFEYLLSSTPFPRLLSLCRIPFDPGSYSHNKVLVFNLGFDAKGPDDVHWIYYPDPAVSFYRVGFYDNIFGTPRMSLYVELGYESAAVLDAAAIASAKQRVLADLAKVGVLGGQRLVAEHTVVLDPAYVHITRASLAAVAAQKQLLAARGVYSAGRYGSWTYCSIEDNIVEARELASRFNTLQAQGLS